MYGNFRQGRPSQGTLYQPSPPGSIMISNRRLENINCIIEPTTNMGALYLGDIVSTLKPNLLQ